MMNVAHYLDAAVRRSPHAAAFVHDGRDYGYAEIQAAANRLANGLAAAGIGRGSRVVLASTNRPGFVVAYFGILKTGATAITVDFRSTPRDFATLLEDADANVVICADGAGDTAIAERAAEAIERTGRDLPCWIVTRDLADESSVLGLPTIGRLMASASATFETVSPADDDVAVVIYTSGTTGKRKGAQITHRNIHAVAAMTLTLAEADLCRRRLAPNDFDCIMSQLFLIVVPVMCGHTTVLLEETDAESVWRAVVAHGINYLVDVPLFYKELLDAADTVDAAAVRKSLRVCATGGAALPRQWSDTFSERFGAWLLPGYGATEVTATVSWTCPGDAYTFASAGRPVPGVSVRVVDDGGAALPAGSVGEIMVRSPGLMKGYLGMAKATAAVIRDGWYKTGDYGQLDDQGYLYVRGRMDDKIMRGYERIDPIELESILHEHPAVRMAAVFGVPDPDLGHEAKALVVLKDDRTVRESELLAWLRQQVAEPRCPGILQVRDSLPLTDTGKVARHLLS